MNIFRLTQNKKDQDTPEMPQSMPEEQEDVTPAVPEQTGLQVADDGDILQYLDKIDKQVSEIMERPQYAENAEITELREMLEDFDTKLSKTRDEICTRVHDEDVKCYRNVKGLVEELEQTVKAQKEENEEIAENNLIRIRKSFKGMKFFIALIVVLILLLLALQFIDIDIPKISLSLMIGL